jgi:hypothetical protein
VRAQAGSLLGDTLNGGLGDDYLNGYFGNDYLDGGSGADQMIGWEGNDTYVVDNVGDVVIENYTGGYFSDAGGIDIVLTSITYTLGDYLENLALIGAGNINGTGNSLDNIITGNSGNNTLDGGLGNDALIGGAGDDLYIVDGGTTINEYRNQGIDTIESSVNTTLVYLENVENISLTGFNNLWATGNDLSNVLTGNSGHNALNGGAGTDTLDGAAGNDALDGGLGYDIATFSGNKNQYSVTYNVGTGVYTISDTVANRDGVDTLASIEKLDFVDGQLYLNTTPISSIQSIGLSPDGLSLLIRVDDITQSVPLGAAINFNGSTVTTTDLTNSLTPVVAFTDNTGGGTGYVLPTVYSGPVSFLEYQLFDNTDGAVITAPVGTNDFIYLSSTNTAANKATNGNGGQDVIAGGVGSSFIAGGDGHSSTFFLDGRADGISWSTITDFTIGGDSLTIWGWNPGSSYLNTSNPIINGAAGYTGLTLYMNNLAPDGAGSDYINPALNQITLSGHTLSNFGYDSITALNTALQNLSQQAMNNSGANIIASHTASNGHFTVGQTTDDVGVGIHWYLNVQ